MRRSGVALCVAIVALMTFAACSSSAAKTATTTGTTSPSTLSGPGSSAVRILSLTGPSAAPTCNAPTQVELHWETRGAKTVTLRINGGPVFASYANGKRDELVPLACDGTPQAYLLTARAANGDSATKSVTVEPRALSAS
jgi:hypothetical protein